MSNYLNRALITKINTLKALCDSRGLIVAQTNSRLNGKYLEAIRIYRDQSDRGHPARALHVASDLRGVGEIIRTLSAA